MMDGASTPGSGSDPQGTLGGGASRLTWFGDSPPPKSARFLHRWRATRRALLVDALGCLTVATLWFSQARSETLLRGDWGFYNRVPLSAPLLWALLVNIVGLAAIGLAGVQVVRRLRAPACRRAAAIAGMAALVIGLSFAASAHTSVLPWRDAIGRPWGAAVGAAALAAAVAWPRRTLWAIRALALVASPLAVVTVLHILWMFLEVAAGPAWPRSDPAPLNRAPPSLRRVVWLVLDELDQRAAFEARPTGLELPELDRLRRESLYADDARPPAGATNLSMPALITGRPVVAVAPVSPNDVELTFSDGKVVRWSAQATVFSRARAMGYDTAAIGWDLPYPRALGGSLGTADWRPSEFHEQARGDTFAQSLRSQWGTLVPALHIRRLASQRLAELGDLALRTAADPRFGLVLLHLPLPRPPGIYDRATSALTVWNFKGPDAEYADNLALVDRTLTELRRVLLRAGLADRTWLVVSADRWRPAVPPAGEVDRRVPFLVRPPAGGRTTHVDGPLNTLVAHDLTLAILRGSIADAPAAAAWLGRNPVAPPRDYASGGRPLY